MSTRPRCRARPSIEAPSAGSTISGNRVTMSIFIWFAVGAPAPGRLTQARLDRPQGRLACGCASASGLRLALRPDGRRITARLQLEQAGRRPDHDPPGRHVHVDHDLGDPRDQTLAPVAPHDPAAPPGAKRAPPLPTAHADPRMAEPPSLPNSPSPP